MGNATMPTFMNRTTNREIFSKVTFYACLCGAMPWMYSPNVTTNRERRQSTKRVLGAEWHVGGMCSKSASKQQAGDKYIACSQSTRPANSKDVD